MAFPPQFANLGKKTKDLFKKTYDFKNELKVLSKSDQVLIETGGYQAKALTGYTKANWTDSSLGAFEVEAHSNGDLKGKLISKKVSDVGFTVEGVSNAASTVLSVEGAYGKDSFAASAKVNHSISKGDTTVNVAAVVGHDGIAVGGSCDLNAANASSPTDYNIGAECQQKDLIATVVTSNQLNDITVSYFQNISSTLGLGSSLLVKPDSGSRVFTFGGEFSLDKFTTFKFKADSNGIVGSTVTHTLSNPAVKVLASAQFDTQSADIFAPQKFGLSLSFGDF